MRDYAKTIVAYATYDFAASEHRIYLRSHKIDLAGVLSGTMLSPFHAVRTCLFKLHSNMLLPFFHNCFYSEKIFNVYVLAINEKKMILI
jgi:hypothetical protein